MEDEDITGSSASRATQRNSAARYLALDVGAKRIGVAISDPLGLTAQPLLTMTRKTNPREDLRSVSRLARQRGCTEFLVGLPLRLSGESSAQTERVRRFARQLAEYSGLPVRMWDERLTTQEAHGILYAAGKPRQQHRQLVDLVAATLILQSFLDHPGLDHSGLDHPGLDGPGSIQREDAGAATLESLREARVEHDDDGRDQRTLF